MRPIGRDSQCTFYKLKVNPDFWEDSIDVSNNSNKCYHGVPWKRITTYLQFCPSLSSLKMLIVEKNKEMREQCLKQLELNS